MPRRSGVCSGCSETPGSKTCHGLGPRRCGRAGRRGLVERPCEICEARLSGEAMEEVFGGWGGHGVDRAYGRAWYGGGRGVGVPGARCQCTAGETRDRVRKMGRIDKNQTKLQFGWRKSSSPAGDGADPGPEGGPGMSSAVQAEDDSELRDPELIVARFREYDRSLYASRVALDQEALLDYLTHIAMPRLRAAERESLMASLTLEEMDGALGGMAEGRAPGPDGLTVHFYKAYKNLLLPHLKEVYEEMVEGGLMPPSMRAPRVVLILPSAVATKCRMLKFMLRYWRITWPE
ncbi:hypothetical protein NDU88_001899 [Pleurodeles waltl]|uniref:Uncharacterized protein n=1 Tax=Pleurodeles waltl TaxID=8319 RepID=A0AAV7LEH1_PLEWA|nr:hypothetical protein NDU88_001899 [Pleurodeles waltl]